MIPVAFFSYSHFDDAHDRADLSRLRERFESEVRAQYGAELKVFHDRRDIGWGQTWRLLIDDTIRSATFLIPVLTPMFLASDECRHELEAFLDREQKLQRDDLILPIYYINCPALESGANSDGAIGTLLRSRHYVDWRNMRNRSVMSRKGRDAVTDLGKRFLAAVSRVGSLPNVMTEPITVTAVSLSMATSKRVTDLQSIQTPLPNPRTSFVGRTREVTEVTKGLRDSGTQLVTLHGPSGVGKTRLAIEVARGLQDHFADGICFVELAPITEPGLVFLTIADSLRIRKEGDPESLLKEVLGRRRILLLLDNFEGVMQVAPDLGRLLAACPSTKTLVTSQAPLRIAIEEAIPVAPLSFPEPAGIRTTTDLLQYEGVALFVERARQADPEFKMTAENARAIVSICKYVEGLPVWLEPFAALARFLTPHQIEQRVARHSWLATGPRDMPDRQKTPRAMYDWSQHLLDEAEQVLFRRLSVFVGGCTVEAAETVSLVAGRLSIDVAGGIASLAEKSLLLLERRTDGSRRFRMSEPIRWHAVKQLEASGEGDQLQDAHAHYYLQLVEQLTALGNEKPEEWQARLEAEHYNLRAAIEWSLERGQVEIPLRLGDALWRFWRAAHLSEGRKLLSDILASSATSESPQARAHLLSAAGKLALAQGDVAHAQTHLEDSLKLWRELREAGGAAEVLSALSSLAFDTGNDAEAMRYAQESLERYEQLTGEPLRLHGTARAHSQLGGVAYIQGFTGDRAAAAESFAKATAHFTASRTLSEKGARKAQVAHSCQDLAYVALGEHIILGKGNLSQAESLLKAGLAVFKDIKDAYRIAAALVGLAAVALAVRQPERAAQLLGSAEVLRESHELHLVRFLKPVHDWTREQARGCLAATAGAFETAWQAGRMKALSDAVALATQVQCAESANPCANVGADVFTSV